MHVYIMRQHFNARGKAKPRYYQSPRFALILGSMQFIKQGESSAAVKSSYEKDRKYLG